MQPVESTKVKHTRLRIAGALVLLVLALSSFAVIANPLSNQSNGQVKVDKTLSLEINDAINATIHQGIALSLNVTVTNPQGHRIANIYEPHDLIVNNFYHWLIAFLDNAQSLQTISTTMTDVGSTTRTVNVWYSAVTSPPCNVEMLNCANAGQGGLIEVGTSSVAATRSDVVLGNPFQTYFYTSSACSQGTTDSVLVSGSENANSGATISESGLFVQGTGGGAVGGHTYMLAHDIFSGIPVSGGNTITVQYAWSLNNAGFNYNLCEFLAAMFTQPNGAGNQIKTPNALMVFYDTLGRNVSWAPACYNAGISAGAPLWYLSPSTPSASTCQSWSAANIANAIQIAIGTGSNAFTPTTRSLTTFYAENYITSTSYDAAGNAYETANILLVTGATISEAAIYLTLPFGCIGYSPLHGAGNGACITASTTDTIMLMAATFAPQVVGNGISIGVTFQESG